MNPPLSLHGAHLRTYKTIFQHPISHNLEWREVHALMEKLGTVEPEHNGNFKVTRNGQSLVLHPSRKKDVTEMDEVIALRHFLERSDTPLPKADENEVHGLLVIDHREIRLFRSEIKGSSSEQILPHAPEEYFRQAHLSKSFTRGKEKPDPNSYFEPVAHALQNISRILLLGNGTGMSSEMDQFISWLKQHHPELAKRIIGSLSVDEHHLTEGQLLAKAREYYAQTIKPTT